MKEEEPKRHEGSFQHLPFVGGVIEEDETHPIVKNHEYYYGHIPKDQFPDYVHVLYRRGWADELQTEVTWTSVRPVATVTVYEGDTETGQ